MFNFSSVNFGVHRLAVIMTRKLKELHPDYVFMLADLMKPKKSRTVEIYSFLLNAVIFDQGNRYFMFKTVQKFFRFYESEFQ